MLVEGPSGIRILVDGGGQLRGDYDVGQIRAYPPTPLQKDKDPRLRDKQSSPTGTIQGGLTYVLRHFKVRRFVTGAYFPRETRFLDLMALAREEGIPVELWKRGEAPLLRRHESGGPESGTGNIAREPQQRFSCPQIALREDFISPYRRH